MQAPRQRSLRQGDRSSVTRRLPALVPHCLGFHLVTSSLLPLPCCLFLVASFLLPHLARFIVRLIGCLCFYLRGSVDLAVGLAIKWPAALPSSTAGSSCQRLSYRRSRPLESDNRESSYCRSTHCRSTHRGLSHRRCDVNKRQVHFRGKKNDRLMIGKKPPNPVGTEEENQGRKDLVVVQSFRINLCDQWCIELFAKSRLHLGDLTRLCSAKPSLPTTTFLPYGEFS